MMRSPVLRVMDFSVTLISALETFDLFSRKLGILRVP